MLPSPFQSRLGVNPLHYLLLGLLLGLTAGLSPGPLLGLVLAESIQHGTWRGILVAMVPLLTDIVIVFTAVSVMRHMPPKGLQILNFVGAFVVAVAAIRTYVGGHAPPSVGNLTAGFLQAITVNLLNPHAWLFWFLVAGPITASALHQTVWDAVGFLATFYGGLVGVKILIAIIVGQKAQGFRATTHRFVLSATALGLLVASGLLLIQAFLG